MTTPDPTILSNALAPVFIELGKDLGTKVLASTWGKTKQEAGYG